MMENCFCFPCTGNSEWSQPVSGASILGGGVGLITGLVVGNVPFAVVSGILAISGAILGARIRGLKPVRELGHSVEALGDNTERLLEAEKEIDEDLDELRDGRAVFQKRLSIIEKEREDLDARQRESLQTIERMTDELEALKAVNHPLFTAYEQMKQLLSEEEAIEEDRRETVGLLQNAGQGIHATLPRLLEAVKRISEERKGLKQERSQLESVIQHMREEQGGLQESIRRFEKLQREAKSVEEIERTVREERRQLEALAAKLEAKMAAAQPPGGV